jgi:hypothetical protein
MNNTNYSFGQSVLKTLIRGVLLLGPIAIHFLPVGWMSMTLGGALVLIFDWLKAKYPSL